MAELPAPEGLLLALNKSESKSEDTVEDHNPLSDAASDLIEAVKSGSAEQVLDALKLLKELS